MGLVAGPARRQECQEAGSGGGGTQTRHPDASIVDHAGSFRRHTRTSNGTTGRLTAEKKQRLKQAYERKETETIDPGPGCKSQTVFRRPRRWTGGDGPDGPCSP